MVRGVGEDMRNKSADLIAACVEGGRTCSTRIRILWVLYAAFAFVWLVPVHYDNRRVASSIENREVFNVAVRVRVVQLQREEQVAWKVILMALDMAVNQRRAK